MNDLISIIIPFYNEKKYLSDCIRSALSQNYKNFEIVLADDGSTDESSGIAGSFASKNPCIQLIKTPHKGIASARNTGLKAAKGDWIFFLDGDDKIASSTLNILLDNALKTRADISVGSHSLSPILDLNITSVPYRTISSRQRLHHYYLTAGRGSRFIWGKLIKKSLFTGLSFNDGHVYEDVMIWPHLMEHVNRAVFTDKKLYFHRLHESSITYSKDMRSYNDGLISEYSGLDFYKKNYPEFIVPARESVLAFSLFAISRLYPDGFNKEEFSYGEKLKGFSYRAFSAAMEQCLYLSEFILKGKKHISRQDSLKIQKYRLLYFALKHFPFAIIRSCRLYSFINSGRFKR